MLIKERYGLASVIKTLTFSILSFDNMPSTSMLPIVSLFLYMLASGVHGTFLFVRVYNQRFIL